MRININKAGKAS